MERTLKLELTGRDIGFVSEAVNQLAAKVARDAEKARRKADELDIIDRAMESTRNKVAAALWALDTQ